MNQYTVDLPYPPLNELDVNVEFGQIMLSNLGGLHSEMNAVSLYFYNHIISERVWPELSEAMEKISVVEMYHLEIFAKMACHLGVDPRLWDCKHDLLEYWSPGYNVYPQQVRAMLQNSIIQEQQTIELYQQQINCIPDVTIQSILKRIILDEQYHIQIFQSFLTQLNEKQNSVM